MSEAQELVDMLADFLAEEEAKKPGVTRGDSQALVDTLADSLAEVETETLGDTLSD